MLNINLLHDDFGGNRMGALRNRMISEGIARR